MDSHMGTKDGVQRGWGRLSSTAASTDIASESSDSLIGRWVLDQFQIVRRLGSGGMGHVYLAVQTAMERKAAVKFVRFSEAAVRHRFRTEARAISRLVHPNIVTVYNFGELRDGSLFLAMEYVDGPNLHDLMSSEAIPARRAIDLAIQATSALEYAHQHQIVHRDFKPGNLMVGKRLGRDHLKVLDFGLARISQDSDETLPGEILGTPQYMSPEQCRGEAATPLSDQYCLGLVIYELLAGRPAFEGRSIYELLKKQQLAQPAPLSEECGDSRIAELEPVIARMLAKTPEARYPDLRSLQDALRRVAANLQDETLGSASESARLPPLRAELESEGPQTERTIARVDILGHAGVLDERTIAELDLPGFRLRGPFERPKALGREARKSSMAILGTSESGWDAAAKRFKEAGITESKTLVCVNAPPTSSAAAGAIGRFNQVHLGRHPVPPECLRPQLRWMREGGDLIEHFASTGVQLLQVSASHLKGAYIESMVEDLRAQGLHRALLRNVEAVAEEMIMNAIFHAPVSSDGHKRYSRLDRSTAVTLGPGEEAVLRWAVTDNHVALSIQDPFGSLTSEQIIAALAQVRTKSLSSTALGAGLGLQIMSRAARHLMISLFPGASCEILAIVDKSPRPATEHTVSVLQGTIPGEERLGDRLWLTEVVGAGPPRLRLRGHINETSKFDSIFSRGSEVRLDLGGVKGINSSGTVAWSRASLHRNPSLRLSLERCPSPIVQQFGMLRDFADGCTVASILLPYYCDHCDDDFVDTLALPTDRDRLPPTKHCPKCDAEAEFLEIPELYFSFLDEPV